MIDASESSTPPVPAVDSSHHRINAFARRTVGLRVRGQDFEALSRWTVGRVRALALPGIEHYERLLAGGFDGYLEKPIRYKEFLSSVAALLKGRSQ